MPIEPTKPQQSPGDAELHDRVARELEQLQAQLAEIELRRRAQVEAELQERAIRDGAADPNVLGIPE
jgi:hypothetical protein